LATSCSPQNTDFRKQNHSVYKLIVSTPAPTFLYFKSFNLLEGNTDSTSRWKTKQGIVHKMLYVKNKFLFIERYTPCSIAFTIWCNFCVLDLTTWFLYKKAASPCLRFRSLFSSWQILQALGWCRNGTQSWIVLGYIF
jgi:hypothetical protein